MEKKKEKKKEKLVAKYVGFRAAGAGQACTHEELSSFTALSVSSSSPPFISYGGGGPKRSVDRREIKIESRARHVPVCWTGK